MKAKKLIKWLEGEGSFWIEAFVFLLFFLFFFFLGIPIFETLIVALGIEGR